MTKGKDKKKPGKEEKEELGEVDKEFYEIQIIDLNQKLTRGIVIEEIKMGKKGKKGDKQAEFEEDPKEVVSNVDKKFYEIQLVETNRKLARLRTRNAELTTENEETKRNLQKLDEDRADIIAYLKRTLQAKVEEIAELQERLLALQQAKEAERAGLQDKIKSMEHDFKLMQDQLTSEIKLLDGKLNSLEDFRSAREDLMNKFTVQEEAIAEQEQRHKREVYEVERKFIVGKDELKKDMEARLLQLSLDFQNTTQTRIAATTQRVMRENVAINNELKILVKSWHQISDENDRFKSVEKEKSIEIKVLTEEKDKVLAQNKVQAKVIERLTYEHKKLVTRFTEFSHYESKCGMLTAKLEQVQQECRDAITRGNKLQQLLHAKMQEDSKCSIDLEETRQHCCHLESIIQTAAQAVQDVIDAKAQKVIDAQAILQALTDAQAVRDVIDDQAVQDITDSQIVQDITDAQAVEDTLKVEEKEPKDSTHLLAQRSSLLHTLLAILDTALDIKTESPKILPSISTLSPSRMNLLAAGSYSTGDLGLIPK